MTWGFVVSTEKTMDWKLIPEDPQEKNTEVWLIEHKDYLAEIWLRKKSGKGVLNFYSDDKRLQTARFDSFKRAKSSGRRWLRSVVKREINGLQQFLNDL